MKAEGISKVVLTLIAVLVFASQGEAGIFRRGGSCRGGGCSGGNCSSNSGAAVQTEATYQTESVPAPATQAAGSVECAGLLDEFNRERLKVGAAPLVFDSVLSASSQKQADEQAARNTMHHSKNLGAASQEIVAHGQTTVVEVTRDWMSSPGHRAAILNPLNRSVGFGFRSGFWAAQFSQRTSTTVQYLQSGNCPPGKVCK